MTMVLVLFLGLTRIRHLLYSRLWWYNFWFIRYHFLTFLQGYLIAFSVEINAKPSIHLYHTAPSTHLYSTDTKTSDLYHLPAWKFLNASLLFSQSISSARLTLTPLSADSIFAFFPSENSHLCSLTVTRPSLISSSPRIMANGTSSFSPALN